MLTSVESRHITLRGPIRVVFRQDEDEWRATALEFDIAGFGDDKKSAFTMLQELLQEYLFAVAHLLHDGKEVEFFNPSGSDEWNGANSVEEFNIEFTVRIPPGELSDRISYRGLGQLVAFINSLEDLDVRLVPA